MQSKDHHVLIDELKSLLDLLDPELAAWNKKYFYSRKRRYESDLRLVQEHYSSGEILEVGSVPLHLTYCLKKMGYPIIGLDLNPDRMKEFIKKFDLNIVKCDVEQQQIPFEDNRFSLVLFNDIVEHLRINPIHALKEVNRILKPSGVLILTTSNMYYILTVLRFLAGRGINNPYKEFDKLNKIGHMGHLREYSIRDLKEFLENTGFEVSSAICTYYPKIGKIGTVFNFCIKLVPKWWRPSLIVVSKKRENQY